jgi:hypothetical protein
MVAMNPSDLRLEAFLEDQASWLEEYATLCSNAGASLPAFTRRRDMESRAEALLRRANICRETLSKLRGTDDSSDTH